MAYVNDLQSKRKTKEDQGEEFGEQKTSLHSKRPCSTEELRNDFPQTGRAEVGARD